MVDSDLRSIVPEWIELLAGPILKGGYDFVAPLYSRYKYDGTITNNIAYPLTRALYGAQIRQPIGGDFAVSGDLVERYLDLDTWSSPVARFGIDIWMTHSAINEGFAACQARLGAKIHDPKDPASDLGPMFQQVVGTLFDLAGVYQDRWLTVHGSHPIPEYGFERVVAPEEFTVDHAKLIHAFRGRARPTPAPGARCSLPSSSTGSWASRPESRRRSSSRRSCGCDACTTRWRRTTRPGADRERLLAALTTLYFGRTAGFIAETRDMTSEQAERVIDAQAATFEHLKPYLVKRWREAHPEPAAG